MTVRELAERCGFSILCGSGDREVSGGIYCCDLLSIVMGRAPADCAWVTVMGNLNSIAVAVMADCACIVLAEGMPLDPEAKDRGDREDVAVLATSQPVYQAARAIEEALKIV